MNLIISLKQLNHLISHCLQLGMNKQENIGLDMF